MNDIKQDSSTVEVGLPQMFHAPPKMPPSITILETCFTMKIAFNTTILVYLTWNTAKKHENAYWWLDIVFCKNLQYLKFCLTHSFYPTMVTTRAQTKQQIATILCHSNKINSEMYLLGFQQVWGLCATLFLLNSIRFFFIQQNRIYIHESIFQSMLSFSSVYRHQNINFKVLALL